VVDLKWCIPVQSTEFRSFAHCCLSLLVLPVDPLPPHLLPLLRFLMLPLFGPPASPFFSLLLCAPLWHTQGEQEGIWAWQRINALFNWLPLAAMIEKKIIHDTGASGGPSHHVSQIEELQRPITMESGSHGAHGPPVVSLSLIAVSLWHCVTIALSPVSLLQFVSL